MRKNLLLAIGLLFTGTFTFAQAPAVNDDVRPSDKDGIYVEKVPEVEGWDNFEGGFKKGSLMPDYTFYTLDGKQVTISNVLKQTHKPVLLVSGNYSCNVFRRNLEEINNIARYYKDRLNVYIVYTIEAHPVKGVQAYPLIPPAVEQNKKDGVNMKQASTYRDRRMAVAEMRKNLEVAPTIVLDGPGNEWWSNAGNAPNNAYLLNTKGVIVAKNGWFNGSMWCSIDGLLHTHSGHCKPKKAK